MQCGQHFGGARHRRGVTEQGGRELGDARVGEAPQLRGDIDIADVLDMAAAIAWVGEQPDRAAEQQARLLRILVDGLRMPATHIT